MVCDAPAVYHEWLREIGEAGSCYVLLLRWALTAGTVTQSRRKEAQSTVMLATAHLEAEAERSGGQQVRASVVRRQERCFRRYTHC